MKIFINAETNKEIFQITDSTTFHVKSQIDNDKASIQIVASTQCNEPIVLIEYKFDKDEGENEQEYLDDMSEMVRLVEVLATDIEKAVDDVKKNHSVTSENTYIINIYDYITDTTESESFSMDYWITIKELIYLEATK